MCICAIHEVWYWLILILGMVFTIWTVYLNRKERETDRYIASLERENDRLVNEVYDLEEKLENERTRFKATVNLLTKQ